MDTIEYYRAIQQAVGVKTKSEAKKRYERDKLARALTESVNYVPDAKLRGIPYPMVIVPYANDPNICKIESVDNTEMTFEIGDVVDAGDKKWLVTSKEQIEFAQSFGEMRLCNQEFRWQDADGIIRSVPGVFSTSYRSWRLDRNFNDAHGQFEGLLPYTEETKRIPLNKRLIMWAGYDETGNEIPVVFKVNRIDHNSYEYGKDSIIVMEFVRDTYNPNDSLEYMIADYVPVVQPEPGARLVSVIKGGATVKIGGNKRKLIPEFRSAAVLGDPLRAVWEFEAPDAASGFVFSEDAGDGCISIWIEGGAPRSLIGETIKVTLSDSMGVFESSDKILEVI